jgi:hypothetical protein
MRVRLSLRRDRVSECSGKLPVDEFEDSGVIIARAPWPRGPAELAAASRFLDDKAGSEWQGFSLRPWRILCALCG